MANRLAQETSPYLLQHAHNPVEWYPWGPEAFERARREDRPILLSVGYSACHWCHVMERESFEDDVTARVMNDLFVNVKVDREERPDVDSIYMQAVQAMNGHGGWPMTVFLTPRLEPFWAGTYFPPTDRQGMPSFQRVLHAVADAYRNRPDDVARVADSMRQMYASTRERARSSGALTRDILERAARGLLGQVDRRFGGFGDAPKFPQPMAMEFLLQQWARSGNEAGLDAVRFSYRRMYQGGIYDQIGGGFARYSVDAQWLVPHFEKMLYDNALLLRLGAHLLQIGGDPEFEDELRIIIAETIGWLEREMTSSGGGFCSALDADSEGEEGKFYVWSLSELRDTLGEDADALIGYWSASAAGNFEDHNILNVREDARRPPSDRLIRAKRALLAARDKRVRPARDDKIIASWNSLMLRALCDAARATGNAHYAALAIRNGEFLFREMVNDDRVFRSHKDGISRITGFLEDYTGLALGSLALYELTLEPLWLDRARSLAASMRRWFWDDEAHAFFDTPSDHEELLTRPRDYTDNATPSGTSMAAELLLRLGDLCGDADMTRQGQFILETVAEPMARYPLAFGHALTAADLAVYGAVEVALVGDPLSVEFTALRRVVDEAYVPTLVVAGGPMAADVPLLADRSARDGRATAYVCRGYVCDAPTTDAKELFDQLRRVSRESAA